MNDVRQTSPIRAQQRLQNEPPSSPAPAPAMRSIVDDVAAAIDRLRRIEGERGLYSMLETLLDGSRRTLIEHGVMPRDGGSAEVESLHQQLKAVQHNAELNKRYAEHYANALSEIVARGGDSEVGKAYISLAKQALRTNIT